MTITNPLHWVEQGQFKGDKWDKIVEMITDVNLNSDDRHADPHPHAPQAHKTTHQNGGGDEISVTGLSGLLADPQTPAAHSPAAHEASHRSGGGDALTDVAFLAGNQTINGVKTFGSIPVLPASDPTTDNQAARKAYVDTKGGFPLNPSSNLVTINSRLAFLLYQDDYDLDLYNHLEKPMFWVISGNTTGAENGTNYFRIDNTNNDLRWYSSSDIISTKFDPPKYVPRMCVIELEDFFYDDIGTSDRFFIVIKGLFWDFSASNMVERTVATLKGENNVYYHLNDGAYYDTFWGNPETLGHHTLRFFVAPMTYTASGKRGYYRIECTGKTAVTGHQNTVFNDDNDFFICWSNWVISPTLSSGWDILTHLDKIRIYARDNDDL